MQTLTQPLNGEYGVSKATATSWTGKIGLAIASTALVALAAHVSLPLPFSPVPLTLQPFAVLMLGLLLGPRMAFSTMLLYLAEGAAGLPVFSPLGLGGVAQLLGPTGGYLLSYPLAAAAAGWLARSLDPQMSSSNRGLVAATAGTGVIFLGGAAWLAALLHLGLGRTWQMAVQPFLAGEAVKVVAAALLYSAATKIRTGKQAGPQASSALSAERSMKESNAS